MSGLMDYLGGQVQPDPSQPQQMTLQQLLAMLGSPDLSGAQPPPASPGAPPMAGAPQAPGPSAPSAPSAPPMSPSLPQMQPSAGPQAPPSPVAAPENPGIMGMLRNPNAARVLLSAGAALMQAGGPSTKQTSFGQALGSGINAGTQAYDEGNALDMQKKQQLQALGANQWTTLTPAQVKAAKLQDLPPGYVWQQNGNGEDKPVGENPIKEGVDPVTGMPSLIDTRKLGQGTPGAAAKPSGAIPGPYDAQTLDTAATTVMSDPNRIRDYASFGQTGMAARMQIQKAMSQKLAAAGMTNSDLVALRARAHAEGGNVATLTKQQAQLTAADQLVHANGDRLLQLFDTVDQTGIPMIEGITRSARAKAGGVDPAELQSVLTTFQTEVAKMLGGNPNMSGVISDSMRQEIMKMSPGSMSTDQAKRIINRLYLETSVRKQAVDDQLNQGVNQSVVGGTPTTQPAAGAAPAASGGMTYDPATGTFH